MKNFIYHRVFAYIVTIVLHIGNFVFLTVNLEKKINLFPDLLIFKTFQPRYLTVWNVVFQVVYASVSLFIDLMALKGKEDTVPKRLTKFRTVFFSAIVLPYTVLVFTLFWSIYSYDRNLVFPTRADLFVPKTSNHILHTFIILVALWELVFQQRHVVTSHKKNCWYIFGMYCLYNSVKLIMGTSDTTLHKVWYSWKKHGSCGLLAAAMIRLFYTHYGDVGLWPYNVLNALQGTIFFPLFFIHIIITLYTSYFLQWRLKSSIWALRERISVKRA